MKGHNSGLSKTSPKYKQVLTTKHITLILSKTWNYNTVTLFYLRL